MIEDLESFGCTRKISFFQIKLAAVLRHLRRPELAIMVLQRCFGPFGLDISTHRFYGHGPAQLRAALLKEMLLLGEHHVGTLANSASIDREQFIVFTILYLNYAHPYLSSAEQVRLYDGLKKWLRGSKLDGRLFKSVCLPVFKQLRLLPRYRLDF